MDTNVLQERNADEEGENQPTQALLFGILALVVVVSGLAVRIWWVNARAYPDPYLEEHHAMGEWVELDGSFVDSESENTDGYSLRVVNAERISYQEYLTSYGSSADAEMPDEHELDVKSILCLTLELRNESDALGGALLLGEMALIPTGMPLVYDYDPMLWSKVNSNIEQTSFRIAVLPGTSSVQYVPYGVGDLDATGGIGGRYYNALPDVDTYEFVISNAPIRHVIDIAI